MGTKESARERESLLAALRLAGFADGDIMDLVALVMMQCAKTNADTLRDLMEELRKRNRGKARWRRTAECQQTFVAGVLADTHKVERKAMKLLAALESLALDDLKGKLDSLGDVSTEKQMRLQMYMEAFSQTAAMISNVMKKASETAEEIVRNMK